MRQAEKWWKNWRKCWCNREERLQKFVRETKGDREREERFMIFEQIQSQQDLEAFEEKISEKKAEKFYVKK